MNDIQIDMFEVQLGAALFLQFTVGGETVRILADAGVKASGYSNEHVLDKLRELLDDDLRIDLIIGTHYDEDHLSGLVPIIKDKAFKIGEAWMPPVVNDTVDFAADDLLRENDLLARQFLGEAGTGVLASYQEAKRSDIETLGAVEYALFENRSASIEHKRAARRDDESLDRFFARFAGTGDDPHEIDHCTDLEVEGHPAVIAMADAIRRGAEFELLFGERSSLGGLKAVADRRAHVEPDLVHARSRSIAHLQKSAAKEAINAKALHEVVKALEEENVPMRTEIIDDGTPRRYRWNEKKRRFIAARADATGLIFDLLGPSVSLVRKHRDRLPVLKAGLMAVSFRGEIRSITPSNQLSYIGCFRHAGQSILVTGDAGCVDFKLDRNAYHPKLLAAMAPLHVIQVAHHGGNNAHFYRVLAAANYPGQTDPSFMLLSHATHDKTRPSGEFRDFLLTSLGDDDDIRLLFTSEPTMEKVEDLLGAIHPAVGVRDKKGDIRLVHGTGRWKVEAHAIDIGVPPPPGPIALSENMTITVPPIKFRARRGGNEKRRT
ncbi:hypothetical protein E5675_16755 [Sphingopyxis sp. PAMC25046]|uniref:hypothetical protein n=1 Tax=Sphingopyxis sp. PAMC25046 TaxID=2565556 RepID=UPI00109DCBF2|nr:hypothetical protein [Sphingopyxis sp. PAMC25046]QCB55918.1 hypothetical protein E5675_16755 [Sphingopyxis sp. PAMC25046]